MAELTTLVVTSNADFSDGISTTLNDLDGHVITAATIDDCLPIIEDNNNSISNLVFDLPTDNEDLNSFQRSLRMLKRKDCAKYIPCIGIVQNEIPSDALARQLFFHVLSTPLHDDILPHTIEAAQSDFKRYQALLGEVNSRTSAIGLIKSGKFVLQTLEQAEALTTMLSLACPDPAIVALGLSELLVNAIEHGNLSISYEEKSKLLESGEWESEVRKRLAQDTFKDRFAEIIFERYDDSIKIVITDQGNGFDWRKHVENDPSNSDSKHGRGIAIAIAMGFSNLRYNEKGNQVTATVML